MAEHQAPPLPSESARILNTIDSGEILGASRQLDVLGDCLISLVKASQGESSQLSADIVALVKHVESTRGASSHAIKNGLGQMAWPAFMLTSDSTPLDEFGERVLAAVNTFRVELAEWQLAARDHSVELLASCSAILVYDYSSTVSQTIIALAQSVQPLRVFVPEARSLDGGRKYMPDWSDLNISIEIIPDAAVGWALSRCDVALVGAETLSIEGGCFNTIGSAVVAHEAQRRHVPFHVLSILLKTDLGKATEERSEPMLDFLSLKHPGPKPEKLGRATLSGDFPDLDYTAPAGISSVITERGPLKPADVANAARSVLRVEAPRA